MGPLPIQCSYISFLAWIEETDEEADANPLCHIVPYRTRPGGWPVGGGGGGVDRGKFASTPEDRKGGGGGCGGGCGGGEDEEGFKKRVSDHCITWGAMPGNCCERTFYSSGLDLLHHRRSK